MANITIHQSLAAFDFLPDSALIDVAVCAGVCGCSPNTIWRRTKTGKFPPALKVSEGQTRWRVGDVRQALNALTA